MLESKSYSWHLPRPDHVRQRDLLEFIARLQDYMYLGRGSDGHHIDPDKEVNGADLIMFINLELTLMGLNPVCHGASKNDA